MKPSRAAALGVMAARAFLALTPILTTSEARAGDDVAAAMKDFGLSVWDESFSARTAAGYDDNVLLDQTAKKPSGFFDFGLDAIVFRLPVDVWQCSFIASGDDFRYWRNIGVGNQDLWLGAAKVQRDFGDAWQSGLTLSYGYEDQVLDLLTAANLSALAPTKVIGNTLSVRPFLRRNLGTNYWLELQGEATRQWYDTPAFSYWRGGPKLILGRSYGNHSEVSLGYAVLDQPFDTEARASGTGTSLPGERLAYLVQDVDVVWRHHWGGKNIWTSTTKFNFSATSDNGSGYFSFYRYAASQQLAYEAHGWKVAFNASFEQYDHPVQTADDPALNKLYERGFTVDLRIERAISKWLRAFADYEFDRTISNDAVNEYVANTIKGGLSWEF